MGFVKINQRCWLFQESEREEERESRKERVGGCCWGIDIAHLGKEEGEERERKGKERKIGRAHV